MQGYRTNTEYTGNLGYNSVCYITSRIGWVSMKGIHRWYRYRRNPGKLYNTFCYTYLTKDQPPPSNLVVYSTVQCCSVCVCVFSSHPFWTTSSLDVPAGVTQEEGHTGFLIHLPSAVRALIFVARRIQPFLSLVDSTIELMI